MEESGLWRGGRGGGDGGGGGDDGGGLVEIVEIVEVVVVSYFRVRNWEPGFRCQLQNSRVRAEG